jgi:single-strand DNA-binding protein
MFHTIIIVGNLGRDPEMRYTPSGQAVTNFSLATSRNYTDSSGQQVKETIWFRVATWGKLAETCNQYLKSGKKVLVDASFEVTAQTVRFLSPRGEESTPYPSGDSASSEPASDSDEEIPF